MHNAAAADMDACSTLIQHVFHSLPQSNNSYCRCWPAVPSVHCTECDTTQSRRVPEHIHPQCALARRKRACQNGASAMSGILMPFAARSSQDDCRLGHECAVRSKRGCAAGRLSRISSTHRRDNDDSLPGKSTAHRIQDSFGPPNWNNAL